MKCQNCGKELSKSWKFCVYCGKPLDALGKADVKKPRKSKTLKITIKVKTELNKIEVSGVELYSYVCQNCGFNLSYTKDYLSKTCPYCRTNYVEQVATLQENVRPEKIIPFIVTNDQAKKEFMNWLSKGFWAPRNMKKFSKINELLPMYVPVWLFDAVVTTQWSGQSGMRRSRQVAYKVQEGNIEKTEYRTEHYTEWYPVSGQHEGIYSSLPIPASEALVKHVSRMKKFDRDLLPIVDGYDYEKAEPFDSKYVMSCSVDTSIIQIDDAMPTFTKRILDAERRASLNMISGDERKLSYFDPHIHMVEHKLGYVPLYLSSYYYKKRIYYFIINGMTNSIISEKKPISSVKVLIALILFIAIITLIAYFG